MLWNLRWGFIMFFSSNQNNISYTIKFSERFCLKIHFQMVSMIWRQSCVKQQIYYGKYVYLLIYLLWIFRTDAKLLLFYSAFYCLSHFVSVMNKENLRNKMIMFIFLVGQKINVSQIVSFKGIFLGIWENTVSPQ